MEPRIHGAAVDGRPYDRRTQRQNAHSGLHHGEYGRAQARRVLTNASLPRSRRRQSDGENVTERPSQAVAHLRFLRTGPRKLRRVADAIRGKSVREALVLLKFAEVFAAEPIEKLVRSAVANAGNNHDMNADDLYITRITVDGGPGGRFTKRIDPRAQTRGKRPGSLSGTKDSSGRHAPGNHADLGQPLVREKALRGMAARRYCYS